MKKIGIILFIMGFLLIISALILIFLHHEGAKGLIGGGISILLAGVALIVKSKKKRE